MLKRGLRSRDGTSSPVRRALRLTLAGAALGQFALLVSGVLSARMLGPEARGELALLVLVQAVVSQGGSLGLPLALTYELAQIPKEASAIIAALRRPITLQIALLTAIAATLTAGLTLGPWSGFATPALTFVGSLPGGIGTVFALAILQGQGRFRAFNLLRNVRGVAYAVGVAGLYLTGEGTLMAITICWVFASTLAGVASLGFALSGTRSTHAAKQRGLWRRMVRFGLKGLLGSASPIETFRLDQAIVGPFLSTRALGLYVAGLSFSNLPRLVGQSVGMVAYPHVASSAPRVKRRTMWRAVAFGSVACAVPVALLAPTMGFLVPFLFGDEFTDAVIFAQLLLVAGLFAGIRRVASDACRGAGRPGLGSFAEILSWIAFLASAPVGAISFGAEGVGAAVCVSGALSLGVLLVAAYRNVH